jgi:hypothetical protein
MRSLGVLLSLTAASVIAAPALLSAQQAPVRQAQAPKANQLPRAQPANPDLDVEELTPSQIRRAQETAPPAPSKAAAAKAPSKQSAPAPSRTVACNGVFAKDSSHLKLATLYNAQNITFTEVDGPDGSKVMASVLFPKDPKRRLEVWWENEASRSGTYLIIIGGQSTWTAPKGLRLGMQLGALEKLNGKPFKLTAFGEDNSSTISDWDGGALAELPGGCKAGVRLAANSKATAEEREAVSGESEFVSNATSMKAAKPTVAEIILGY